MRQVVKPNGQPVEVELLFSTGKEDNKGNGVYYAYSLAGEKVMFASVALNEKIQQLQPAKGDRLQICQLPNKNWMVSKLATSASGPGIAAPAHSPADDSSPTQTHTTPSDGSRLPAVVNGSEPNGQQNGNGLSAHGQQNGRIPDAPYSHTGWAAFIREQAMSLIDVTGSCQRYAAEKFPGLLSNGDVADLVITTFIQHSKPNGGPR